MRISKPFQVSYYSLGYMQSPVPHAPDYYTEKFHGVIKNIELIKKYLKLQEI